MSDVNIIQNFVLFEIKVVKVFKILAYLAFDLGEKKQVW